MNKLWFLLCLAACTNTEAPAPDPIPKDGALDLIVLAEFSRDTPGIVLFPHRSHYAPVEEGGRGITCLNCHHDYKGPKSSPPGACRTCHMYHNHGNADLPDL